MSGSDDTAVRAQGLTIDRGAIGAGQEGDGGGDVFRLTKAFAPRQLGQEVDDFLWLASQEQIGGGRAGRHRVDGDIASRLRADIGELMRMDSAQQSRNFAIDAALHYGIVAWELGKIENADGPVRLVRLC